MSLMSSKSMFTIFFPFSRPQLGSTRRFQPHTQKNNFGLFFFIPNISLLKKTTRTERDKTIRGRPPYSWIKFLHIAKSPFDVFLSFFLFQLKPGLERERGNSFWHLGLIRCSFISYGNWSCYASLGGVGYVLEYRWGIIIPPLNISI